jgi:hypothetical protein
VSQILEIRRTPEGKIQARRKDGRPLTPKDKEEANRLAAQLTTAPTADITKGRIIAVEICSDVLEAHIWLAFDDDVKANDGQAVFYADELPFLATKDADTLREFHKVKLAFPGSRVRQ